MNNKALSGGGGCAVNQFHLEILILETALNFQLLIFLHHVALTTLHWHLCVFERQRSDFSKPGSKEHSEPSHGGHAQKPAAQCYKHHHVYTAQQVQKGKICHSDAKN